MAKDKNTVRCYARGHDTYLDVEDGVFRYVDDDTLAESWGGQARPCVQCGQLPTPEGYDACIGHVEGAISVCCGHGIETGFVVWKPATEQDIDNWIIRVGKWFIKLGSTHRYQDS